jgi:hypothetical protein
LARIINKNYKSHDIYIATFNSSQNYDNSDHVFHSPSLNCDPLYYVKQRIGME